MPTPRKRILDAVVAALAAGVPVIGGRAYPNRKVRPRPDDGAPLARVYLLTETGDPDGAGASGMAPERRTATLHIEIIMEQTEGDDESALHDAGDAVEAVMETWSDFLHDAAKVTCKGVDYVIPEEFDQLCGVRIAYDVEYFRPRLIAEPESEEILYAVDPNVGPPHVDEYKPIEELF